MSPRKEKSDLLESRVEDRLTNGIKKLGGLALKFISPGWAGAPDRLVLLSSHEAFFVELKAPKRQLRALQRKRAKELAERGKYTFKADTLTKVDTLIYLLSLGCGLNHIAERLDEL